MGAEQQMSVTVDVLVVKGGPDRNLGPVAAAVRCEGTRGGCVLTVNTRGDSHRLPGQITLLGRITQHAKIEEKAVDVLVMAKALFRPEYDPIM